MAGLLRSEGRSGAKFAAAISAEFFGVLFFALIGAAASYKNFAIANGLALAVLVYATANVSGGHLNPAVTVAALATGHVSVLRGLSYIAAQIGGAIAASALHLALLPKAAAVGCSGPGGGATLGQAVVWELLLTAVLVTVVYAVAIGDKNFAGPAAIGITLAAAALTALPYTGAALNPARTLGPAIVFGCGAGSVRVTLLYVLAQLLGGLAAGAASWPLYGIGPHFGKWGEELRADAEVAYDEAKQALRGTYARLEDQA